MKPSFRPRTPSKLSDSLRHRLDMYALAASAAGVGMLALAQAAEAKVVYTPAHKRLPANKDFYLDLNHDGINDFRFFLESWNSSGSFFRSLLVGPLGHENAIYTSTSYGRRSCCAAALPKGVSVGPKSPFLGTFAVMYLSSCCNEGQVRSGPWLHVTGQAYLGFKLAVKGRIHYGWARMGQPRGTLLTGYAYETVPNKPIITGRTKGPDVDTVQPDTARGSLGRLALGRK